MAEHSGISIAPGYAYLDEIKLLITEYAASLHRDLAFQGYEYEIEHLAEKYGRPQGELLAALNADGKVIGCVAMHRFDEDRWK